MTGPVLAVTVSSRHLGLACIDEHLQLLYVRRCCLRGQAGNAGKVRTVRRRLLEVIARFDPAEVVIETETHPPASPSLSELVDAAVRVARSRDLQVERLAFKDACKVISGTSSVATAAAELAQRFTDEAKRLGFERTLPKDDRFRRLRPILAALAIAYAVAREMLTKRSC